MIRGNHTEDYVLYSSDSDCETGSLDLLGESTAEIRIIMMKPVALPHCHP